MDIIQQLLKLIKINTKISGLHSSDEIMTEIMHEAMSLTGTTAAFILRAAEDRHVSCLARYRSDDAESAPSWSSSSALEAHDAQGMIYSTSALHAGAAPSILAGSIQTLISAPLASDGGGTTMLQLVGRDTTSIDPQTISLLNLFISQVQVTMTRAALEEAAVRNAALAATGELAAQVAHDIRSPLAALQAASDDLTGLREDQRELIRGAMGRIREIAESLLARDRAAAGRASPHKLAELLEPLVEEKRSEFRGKPLLRIESALEDRDVVAQVEPAEFRRALSNLVNNAVEALGDRPGVVGVTLSTRDGSALVRVRDDGPGIPPEILPTLGQRGRSHGKDGGSGLGLHHARNCARRWGGSLELSSEPGRGTTVTMRLPRC